MDFKTDLRQLSIETLARLCKMSYDRHDPSNEQADTYTELWTVLLEKVGDIRKAYDMVTK